MLLAVDVGNTQTAVGLFDVLDEAEPAEHWRISTRREDTPDELFVVICDLLRLAGRVASDVRHGALSSVVPELTSAYRDMFVAHLGTDPLVIGPGVSTGLPILYENPQDVGADRIANAVAALERCGGGPVIILDFGTATTFDAVSTEGEYLGGVIAAGLEISAKALFDSAARLSHVELAAPATTIGRNTRAAIQSGLLLGHAGLVDAIVRRMCAEMEANPPVIATGGLAGMMLELCETITDHDPLLTLRGLGILWRRNAGDAS